MISHGPKHGFTPTPIESRRHKHLVRGFTLIEMLVSLALIAILTNGILCSLGQSGRNWKKLAKGCEKLQAESIVLERICQEVRNAKGIDQKSTPEELILQSGTNKVRYVWKERKIGKKTGNYISYLTDVNETDKMTFTYLGDKRVKIEIGEFGMVAAARNAL